jgi:hypothetical protein
VCGLPDIGSRGLRLIRTRDPIPLSQRLRLLSAAKRVERVSSDAGAVLGEGVITSESLVVCGEGGLAESERFGRLAGRAGVSLPAAGLLTVVKAIAAHWATCSWPPARGNPARNWRRSSSVMSVRRPSLRATRCPPRIAVYTASRPKTGQRARLRDAVRYAAASLGGVLKHVCRPFGAVELTAYGRHSLIRSRERMRGNPDICFVGTQISSAKASWSSLSASPSI